MTSHKLIGLLLIILILPIHGKKSIHIRSNQTHSLKNTPLVVVSGNVEVKVDNITITSDKIVFNKEKKTMISSQNITIKRDNSTSLNPKKMAFDRGGANSVIWDAIIFQWSHNFSEIIDKPQYFPINFDEIKHSHQI